MQTMKTSITAAENMLKHNLPCGNNGILNTKEGHCEIKSK